MGPKRRLDRDVEPLLRSGDLEDGDVESSLLRRSPSRSMSRSSGTPRPKLSKLSRRSMYDLDNKSSDVAFTIVVKKDGGEEGLGQEKLEGTAVDVTHDAVDDAVQDAVNEAMTEAVQDACGQAVQDAVQEAVQEAIQQAIEDNVRFDMRANVYTLVAITGVILYWRGVWTLWDKVFGFSWWSEVASIGTGFIIMVTFRLFGLPLLDGLPGG